MTANLQIRLSTTWPTGDSRATARLQRLAGPDGNAVDEKPFQLRLRSELDVQEIVEPGFYVIEVRWRNGRSSRYNCRIEDREAKIVNLAAPSHVRKVEPSTRDFTRPSAGAMSASSHSHEIFASDDRFDTWRFVCDRSRIERKSQLSMSSMRAERSEDIKLASESTHERNWVEYWADGGWRISSMPFYPRLGSDTCILRSAPDGVPFVVTEDADTAVMVDLIPAGNSESMRIYARSTFEELSSIEKDQLVKKRPLDVCAFAYAEYDLFDSAPWVDLLCQEAKHHSWLPDVSIILGWRLLVRSRNEEQRVAASDLLEQAVNAGVPYYALGVRLLSEALGILSDRSEEIATAASLVQAVALRTVRSEAFTTVRP